MLQTVMDISHWTISATKFFVTRFVCFCVRLAWLPGRLLLMWYSCNFILVVMKNMPTIPVLPFLPDEVATHDIFIPDTQLRWQFHFVEPVFNVARCSHWNHWPKRSCNFLRFGVNWRGTDENRTEVCCTFNLTGIYRVDADKLLLSDICKGSYPKCVTVVVSTCFDTSAHHERLRQSKFSLMFLSEHSVKNRWKLLDRVRQKVNKSNLKSLQKHSRHQKRHPKVWKFFIAFHEESSERYLNSFCCMCQSMRRN